MWSKLYSEVSQTDCRWCGHLLILWLGPINRDTFILSLLWEGYATGCFSDIPDVWQVSAFWGHTIRSLDWKQSPMTTARNLKKFSLCFFYVSCLKRNHFFQQSLSTVLGGFSIPHIPHTSKTTLLPCRPCGAFFKWQLQGIHAPMMYVGLYVLIHTLRSSKSWCFFSLTRARWETTFHPCVYCV